jgi:hypothetical protein
VNPLELRHILAAKINDIHILLDPALSDTFRQHGATSSHMVAQQHTSSRDVMFLRDGKHFLLLEQRAASATKRTVSSNVNAFLLAKVNNLLLRQERVILDLVDSGRGLCTLEQLGQERNTVVADANVAGLLLRKGFHSLPSLDMRPCCLEIARAVRVLGEAIVVAIGVHRDRPVDEEEVDIVQTKSLERLFETQLSAGVVGTPELCGNPDVLTLANTGAEGLLEGFADFILVAVTVGRVNVLVAELEGGEDGGFDLAGLALPGP